MAKPKSHREYKLVVVGCDGVGKSCLTTRFTQDMFWEDYDLHLEDSYRKQWTIDDETVLLDILDTVNPPFGFIMAALKAGVWVVGFLFVYSITSRESLEEITTFHQNILQSKGDRSFSTILVANKCDLEPESEVGIHEGRDLANHLGCKFIETSAKQPVNVDQAFETLVYEIRKRDKTGQAEPVAPGSGDHSAGCRGGFGCAIL